MVMTNLRVLKPAPQVPAGGGAAADPAIQEVVAWLRQVFYLGDTGSLLKGTVYKEYLRACADKKWKPFSGPTLGRLVHRAFPGIDTKRKGPRGRAKYHYQHLNYIDPQLNREKQYKNKKKRRKMNNKNNASLFLEDDEEKSCASRGKPETKVKIYDAEEEELEEEGDETGPPHRLRRRKCNDGLHRRHLLQTHQEIVTGEGIDLITLLTPPIDVPDATAGLPSDAAATKPPSPVAATQISAVAAAAKQQPPPQVFTPQTMVVQTDGAVVSDWTLMSRINQTWDVVTYLENDDPFDAVKECYGIYYDDLVEAVLVDGALDEQALGERVARFWEREWVQQVGPLLDPFWGARCALVYEQEGLDRLNSALLLNPKDWHPVELGHRMLRVAESLPRLMTVATATMGEVFAAEYVNLLRRFSEYASHMGRLFLDGTALVLPKGEQMVMD